MAMAHHVVLAVGMTMFASARANDAADRFQPQGFLSQYMSFDPSSSKTFNHMKNADVDGNHAGVSASPVLDGPFATSQGKPAQPTVLANDNSTPLVLSAIGIALLTLAALVGVRMRRAIQPAAHLAMAHGADMSIPMAQASVDNILELKAQQSSGSAHRKDDFMSGGWWQSPHRQAELKHGRVAMLAASRGVNRKLALQEFSVGVAGVLGGTTLFAPPAAALTEEEQLALYEAGKKKRERKRDLQGANNSGTREQGAKEGANLAGSLPDEDLAAKLADKAGGKQLNSLARDAPGTVKPKDITGQGRIQIDETKSLKELTSEGAPVQKFNGGRDVSEANGGRDPTKELLSEADRRKAAQKKAQEIVEKQKK